MRYVLTLALLAAASTASAQEKDIEPAVNTSSSALTPHATPANPASEPASAGAAAAGQAPASAAHAPAAAQGTTSANKAARGKADAGAKPTAHDQIELDPTQITGNRELPNVMYVVPWKKPELGDLGGRPAKSLVDEALAPVDRDVFRRQNRYFTALQADGAPRAAQPAPPADGAPR
jgi:hypothetical protein